MAELLCAQHCCAHACAVEFRNSLEAKLGVELPGTLVFDYPSISAIARHVSTLLAPVARLMHVAASGGDAFLSTLLDSSAVDAPGVYDLFTGSGTGSLAVDVATVVTRQPAGIMTGGDPTRHVLAMLEYHSLLQSQHALTFDTSACCSRDALAPVGLARYDVDRLSEPLVGGLPYRFTSMLQASHLGCFGLDGCHTRSMT